MATMNRTAFAQELQRGLNTVFGLDYKGYQEEWRKAFNVETSEKAYELDVLVSGFGGAPVKSEGQTTAFDVGSEVWTARYNHLTIALQFALTEESIEDNLYMQMGSKYAKALSRSMVHTKEIMGASVFNNAFTTSGFNGGDGVPLCSTAHPLAGGGTYSNVLSTPADLSETSIEDLLIQIRTAKDERGIPVALNPTGLFIPPQLTYIAKRIVDSDLRSGTTDNDINVIKRDGVFSQAPTVITRLTDPNAWFIKTDCNDGLKHFVRVAMKNRVDIDHDTGDYKYLCRERYSFGWTDWRSVFGSGP